MVNKQTKKEAKKLKRDKRQERNLYKLLATIVRKAREASKIDSTWAAAAERLWLKINVYCKEKKRHWVRDCSNKKKKRDNVAL